MKEQDNITAREPNKTDISNMPGKELKVMVIKLCPGLQKRMNDLSEIPKKEL